MSTDTGSSSQGGLLMCQDGSQWSQLDETFRAGAEAVPVGQISAPVQTQFGYHVIEALELTPENAQPLVLAAVQAADPLEPVIGKFLKQSKITVNPRFGKISRSGNSFTIVPPTPKKVRSRSVHTVDHRPGRHRRDGYRRRSVVEQHDPARLAVTAARVVVVGLGPAGVDLMLPVARTVFERIPHRFVRTRRHPAAEQLEAGDSRSSRSTPATTPPTSFAELYPGIVERLVAAAHDHGEVVYAVPGNPGVAERTVSLLRARRRRGPRRRDPARTLVPRPRVGAPRA